MDAKNVNYSQLISDRITALRKEAAYTQEALAERLGVTFQAVSKWENGLSCPDITLLPLIADVFGISIDSLFGRNEDRRSEYQTPEEQAGFHDDRVLRVRIFLGSQMLKEIPQPVRNIQLETGDNLLSVESQLSVTCGDVEGNITAGEAVCCGDVQGSVTAGKDVNCGDIDGEVSADGNVNCGDVGGNVQAGANAACGDIGGDAGAGQNISSGDIGGSVHCGGDVECGDVGMKIEAGGSVECGDVGGNVHAGGVVSCGDVGGNRITGGGAAGCERADESERFGDIVIR